MQLTTHPTDDAGSSPCTPEAHPRTDVEKLQFLLRVCGRKPYAKPYLIADAKGGHFITSQDHPKNGS